MRNTGTQEVCPQGWTEYGNLMEKLPLIDNWSGFANLLANLIEKYAAVLDIENLPEPPIRLDRSTEENVNNSKHSSDAIGNTETA